MTTKNETRLPNGLASAALLAGAIGSFAIGLLTVLAEASNVIKDLLTLSPSVGSLSGKTIFGVVIWLITWLILGFLWKGKDISLQKIIMGSFVLIGLSILFTFPPFFLLFGR